VLAGIITDRLISNFDQQGGRLARSLFTASKVFGQEYGLRESDL